MDLCNLTDNCLIYIHIFGFRYHQKVPVDCPELVGKAMYGLVSAEQFILPSASPLWSPDAYAAFDITKAPMPDFSVRIHDFMHLFPIVLIIRR